MPLELGIFLGAKRFGTKQNKEKSCLILDREAHRYLAFISDIRGQDVREHHDDSRRIVSLVRNWLTTASRRTTVPGGQVIWERYQAFSGSLPAMCAIARLRPDEITFVDYSNFVSEWLKATT